MTPATAAAPSSPGKGGRTRQEIAQVLLKITTNAQRRQKSMLEIFKNSDLRFRDAKILLKNVVVNG